MEIDGDIHLIHHLNLMMEMMKIRLIANVVKILIRRMEMIQTEVMIRSLLMSKSRVVQPTKVWYHLSQR